MAEGYRIWKKAIWKEGDGVTSNSTAQEMSQASSAFFKRMKNNDTDNSVAVRLVHAYSAKVRENHQCIFVIADMLRFSAVQGTAQRADDEGRVTDVALLILPIIQTNSLSLNSGPRA